MYPTDYIPAKEEDFQDWQQNFLTVVNASHDKWQIPRGELVFLNELQETWEECYAVASKALKETRTHSQVEEKIKARKVLTAAFRFFVGRWITRNPQITDNERNILKVTVREYSHKRPPVPSSKPVCLKIMHIDTLQLVLDVRDENTKDCRRLPEKVREMEVWGIVGEDPRNGFVNSEKKINGHAVFNFIGGFTNHLAKLNFEQGNSGGSFSFRLRWLNSRKEAGPWSDVYSTFIT